MSALSVFGLFAVTAMLAFYALEDRSPWFILAFAVSCALGSVYGFLQGAWPFGVVEAIWAAVAARRWRIRRNQADIRTNAIHFRRGAKQETTELGTSRDRA